MYTQQDKPISLSAFPCCGDSLTHETRHIMCLPQNGMRHDAQLILDPVLKKQPTEMKSRLFGFRQ